MENVRFDRQRRLYKICVGDELFSSMLAFFQSFVFLALQHLLLHAIMPTLKKTLEKVIGPSPTERARVLNVELQRIRDEGITLRGMLSQIIEERGAQDAELLRYGARMRLAGMLSTAELEVLSRAEDRLRRRGIVRGALRYRQIVGVGQVAYKRDTLARRAGRRLEFVGDVQQVILRHAREALARHQVDTSARVGILGGIQERPQLAVSRHQSTGLLDDLGDVDHVAGQEG